jgi:1-acyl-sn-glycerol-3-phosphate acyltransferase
MVSMLGVRTPEKTLRLGLFFTGFFAQVALTGVLIAPVRLLALVAPRAAAEVMRAMIYAWNRCVVLWARAAAGIRLEVEGALPEGANLVIASNHQSILDIPVIVSVLHRARPLFVAKAQMRRGIPNISPSARIAGFAFISRKRGDTAQLAEIERLGARLGPEGASAAIFVEGTRSRDGALGAFKVGGLAALLRAAPGARVLPVAIDGTWRAASFADLFRTFPGMTIRVRVGQPIEVSPEARGRRDALEDLAARLRDFCAAAHCDWRGAPEAAIMGAGGDAHGDDERAPGQADRDPRDRRVRAG